MRSVQSTAWSAFLAAMLATACGSARLGTHVSAGSNLAKSQAQASKDDKQSDDQVINPGSGGSNGSSQDNGGSGSSTGGDSGDSPQSGGSGGGETTGGGTTGGGGQPDPSNGGGGSGGGGGGGGGQPLTCFGPAPSLSADFQAFCAQIPDDMHQTFATAYDLVCNQKRLLNLLLTPCSWNGTGLSSTYRRVLAKTSLSDQTSQDFSFLAAYAVTPQSNIDDELALIFREMTDPNYGQTFVTIKNSHVYNITPHPDGSYDYSVDLASSAATVSFRATLKSQRISDNLAVIYDYAIGDEVLIKTHHFMRFLVRNDDATTRMFVIDEKLIADGGNHQVAYQNLLDVLTQFQERDYANSLRD